ncbi:MAG: hypothetical protein SGJ18_15930 [Pseudomonadota bacterium]|nr:hypothetical protein [Pseudomonadota bacterium]
MRIKERQQKKPGYYPQMIFRVKQDDKERLYASIDKIVDRLNGDSKKRGLHRVRKNDVIVDALSIGLATLEKRLQR